jgi:hypothetical protein
MHRYVRSVLFCEDIRVERNGKEIVIGLYAGGLLTPQVPFQPPSFVIRFELFFGGDVIKSFLMRLKDPTGTTITEQTLVVNFADWQRPGAVFMSFPSLVFPTQGAYSLDTKFGDMDWAETTSFYIDLADQEVAHKALLEQFRMLSKAALDRGLISADDLPVSTR